MTNPTALPATAGANPDEPHFQVVLVCATCTHRFDPGPAGYRAGRTSCPQCRGWVLTAVLVDPTAVGGAPC